ncbi:hypothetical protein FHW88_005004 [Mucilaginibacter sp. SG538B]|uniref:hypothetical protein n=1 Tax=unclassified Mucilaginibacter TaxID=2617802 RepID=UPI00159D1155|nr:hypothetical protein [Mucilaginibacter sp. SG538B]NVM66686.1 hypothetical protein [Mucilaginibacter sp. SG538B]
MEQPALFAEAGQSKGPAHQFFGIFSGFVQPGERDDLLQKFMATAPSKQTVQNMYDKEVLTPRLRNNHSSAELILDRNQMP